MVKEWGEKISGPFDFVLGQEAHSIGDIGFSLLVQIKRSGPSSKTERIGMLCSRLLGF